MSDTKQEFTQTETDARVGKKGTVKRHLKRFWWAYLIGLICIVVLVVCLIIFVGVPNIAQKKLNSAKLDIQGVNVINTKEDEFTMEINSTITTDGGIKAKVYPFEGSMYLVDNGNIDEPFATLNFPETNADKHQVVNVSQTVEIKNKDAFDKFNIWFANNETLTIRVQGKTKVSPSGLSRKYSVDFKKELDIKGLNLFKGTEVIDGKISTDDPSKGPNFIGKAIVPDASVFTLDIGNATFTTFIDEEELGTIELSNLILSPGNNTVDMSARLNNTQVISLVQQDKYCHTGVLPFKIIGKTVVNNGENLTYFQAALASSYQMVPLNISHYFEKSLGFAPGCSSS